MSDYRMREYSDENQAGESATAAGLSPGKGWSIAGIVCAIVGVFLLIPAPVGIVLGIVGRRKGQGTISTVAIVISAIVTLYVVASFAVGIYLGATGALQ